MTTKTEVINGVMAALGQPPSTGPADASTWAKRATDRYNPTVKLLLEQHPWNFASKRVQLQRLNKTPIGYAYAYNKPADCLRIRFINDTGDPEDDSDFAFDDEGGEILCDYAQVYLFYVSSDFLTKEGSWPQTFADAVAVEIASAIAPVATKSDRKSENLYAKALRALKRAKSFDASQKSFRELPRGNWARSRRTGARYNTEGH